MKKVLAIILLLMLVPNACCQLSVEKILLNKDVDVGGTASIALNITNPYSQPVTVKIKDKSVLGGNGLDIQCFEASIPPGGGTIRYEDITPFTEGEFTLEAAEITYQNPDSGKEESSRSNTLKVSVKESKDQTQTQRQGITTIYRCDNMNMQSTSYTSQGGSSSFQVNIGGSLSQQMDDLFNQVQPKSMQDRLNQMQQRMGQDTQALKQQMQNQMADQKQMEQAFQEAVEKSREFKGMQEELKKQGYEHAGNRMMPETENTGDFEYSYKKDNETDTIKGKMKDGKIKELTQWGSRQQKQLEESLMNNPDFQNLDQQLQSQGYQPKQGQISIPSQNKSEFTIQYEKKQNKANITGTINLNGTIEEIKIQKEEDEKSNTWWLIILLLALLALAYYLWKKRKTKEEIVSDEPVFKPNVDYLTNARQMLEEAQRLFNGGEEVMAYAKVSEAVRYYFRHELNHPEDFTDNELIKKLEKKKHKSAKKAGECLNLCGLVKFAKYQTNKKDFQEIVELAKKIL